MVAVEGNLREMPGQLFGENGITKGHTQSPEVKNARQIVQDELQGYDVRSAHGMNGKDGEMPDPLSPFAGGIKRRGWPEESLKRSLGSLKPLHPAKEPPIGQSPLSMKFGIPNGIRSSKRDLL